MKTALITGVCGQDGAYLSKHLLENRYNVIGIARRNTNQDNLKYLGVHDKIKIIDCDITDPFQVQDVIIKYQPQEIYNLAAQSHVGLSFNAPMQTCAVNYGGYLNVLLAARKFVPDAKIYQAGTSEMFGYAAETLANEQTPFAPMSPYAISKVASYWAGVNARYEAEQFVSNGILFNHESPIRGKDFVTRKVTMFVASWRPELKITLKLGNLDSVRDWGHAKDYVNAMHKILQHSHPDDFVIATGEAYNIRHLLIEAFRVIGKEIRFEGVGKDEKGYIDGKCVVEVSPEFYRPNDLKFLRGSAKKARQLLDWRPEVSFEQLIEQMVISDMERL